jgi:hypothetical protein
MSCMNNETPDARASHIIHVYTCTAVEAVMGTDVLEYTAQRSSNLVATRVAVASCIVLQL